METLIKARRAAWSFGVASLLGAQLIASGAAAQGSSTSIDLAQATPSAASILVADPTAAARLNVSDYRAPAPTTAFGAALAGALPRGAAWAQLYERRGYTAIWIAETGAGVDWAKADALLSAARGVEAHGLPLAPYRLNEVEATVAAARVNGDPSALAAAEVRLTRLYLHLGRDLASGALEPSTIRRSLDIAPPRPNPITLLVNASNWSASETAARIDGLAPQTRDYRALMALYQQLLAARDAGGWGAQVPSNGMIRPMDQGARIVTLRQRLKAMGYLPADAVDLIDPASGQVVYGPLTQLAVETFQERNGLKVDGVVGPATFAALNMSIERRIGLVAVNMERARWLNFDLGARHILVNIPAYEARLFDNGVEIFQTDVVVGTRRHQTPEFSDEMTHIVVNPRWHVPYSIATEKLLPELQDNPGALEARNFTVLGNGGYRVDPWSVDWWGLSTDYFPYRLVQGPGPGNALGGVKFIFPNSHAVYLHDTPSRSLFAEVARAFSHGCVRVADPTGLAEVLLAAEYDDPLGYYFALREQRNEVYVNLDNPVPVHLTYRTVWVDAAGVVHMRDDIYGRDQSIFEALQAIGFSV